MKAGVGDVLDVKYMGVDPRTKKQKVSRKECMPKPEGWVERPARPREDRPRRDNDRRAPRRDDRPRRDNDSKSE